MNALVNGGEVGGVGKAPVQPLRTQAYKSRAD